jgi:type IV pilus assembly protein PilF
VTRASLRLRRHAARWTVAAAVLALALGAAGCAVQPATDRAIKPTTPTTGDEGVARERARIHTELAASYFDLGNMSVALEEVKIALAADAAYGPAYNVLGLIYARLKEDRLAEENFQRALRINALDYDANNNYGLFLCQRRREEEGIRHFMEAVRNPLYRDPDRSYVNAGICARQRGDLASAEGYFQQALRVRPTQPQALYQLAEIAFGRGNYGEARGYLNRLTQLVAPGPEVLWLGLRIERKLGDRDTAASYAQQLRNNFPESKEARALSAGRFD